jgi:hypothetical protein
MATDPGRQIANKLMALPTIPKDKKAIARRLGLDSPEGMTAFMSQFKSSYPTMITDRTENLYPQVKEELISKLQGDRINGKLG